MPQTAEVLLLLRPAAQRRRPLAPGARAVQRAGSGRVCRTRYALRRGSERVSGSNPEEMSRMIVFSMDFMSHRLARVGVRVRVRLGVG